MYFFHSSSLHQTVPKLQFNSTFFVNGNVFKQSTRRLFSECCTKKTPKSSGKLTAFGKILIGGTSAVSLALRCNRFIVSCQANRLAGLELFFFEHCFYEMRSSISQINFFNFRLSNESHKK